MRSHFSGNSCFLHASMTPRKRVWSKIGKTKGGKRSPSAEIWVISLLPIWERRIWTQLTPPKRHKYTMYIQYIFYSNYIVFVNCVCVCAPVRMPHHRGRGQRTTYRSRFLSSTKRVLGIQFRSSAMSLSTESLLQPQYSFLWSYVRYACQ